MREQMTNSQARLMNELHNNEIKVIYTAGPIRNKSPWRVYRNLERAKLIARVLWKDNFCVICPQANTEFFDGEDIPDSFFLNNDLTLVYRSDAMVVLPGWKTSEGTKSEIKFAEHEGIPVYYWPDGVPQEIID